MRENHWILTAIMAILCMGVVVYTGYLIYDKQNTEISCFMCCEGGECTCTDVMYDANDNLCHTLYGSYKPVNKTPLVVYGTLY